jgi:tRNA (mo5U34)-methyltransferase
MRLSHDELSHKIKEYTWFHTIDLGDGIRTAGSKKPRILGPESNAIFGPINVEGRSVMDIGAWNGFYTVEAFRRGAREVLSVDSPTWMSPNFRGKETFDLVMSQLCLTPQTKILNVEEISEAEVGKWDIVLMLGVFYHLVDPIAALRRVAPCVKDVLVLETLLDAENINGPAMVLYPGKGVDTLSGKKWGPNRACVEELLRMFGFNRIAYVPNPAPGHGGRGIFHAYK